VLLNKNRKYFIGIDGGGSKTLALLGDDTGKLYLMQQAESSNMKSKPWEKVKLLLVDLIEKTRILGGIAASDLAGIYLGLAGAERYEDKRRVIVAITGLCPQAKIIVQNDAIPALAAGTWGKAGLILIAGTGSIACFYDPYSQQYQRVGGWGYIFGDEGSGFDLGKRAVTHVLRAFDGRGEATALTELILKWLRLQSPAELITFLYENTEMRREIAALSTLVFTAARQKDRIAEQLIEQAIEDLCGLLIPICQKLNPKLTLPLVLNGGIFQDEAFRLQFIRKAKANLPLESINSANHPPILGSYILALQDSGITITNNMKNTLEAEWIALQKPNKMG
jgi:N-acetylglucosamine kinase-like BadF-type ATPase